MTDEQKPPPRFRRPSELDDHEVVEVPVAPVELTRRIPREPFSKLVRTPAETTRDILDLQRKMALQLDGFGQTMNRRFELFHQELALQRATGDETNARLDSLLALVKSDHAPRLDKVEASLGQKVARGGGLLGLVLVAAPLVVEAFPKYRALVEAIIGALP